MTPKEAKAWVEAHRGHRMIQNGACLTCAGAWDRKQRGFDEEPKMAQTLRALEEELSDFNDALTKGGFDRPEVPGHALENPPVPPDPPENRKHRKKILGHLGHDISSRGECISCRPEKTFTLKEDPDSEAAPPPAESSVASANQLREIEIRQAYRELAARNRIEGWKEHDSKRKEKKA